MKKITVIDIVFLILLVLFSIVLMLNFTIQIADYHEDDQPGFYALFFTKPEMFSGDYLHGVPIEIIAPFRIFTSFMMLLPAVAYKYLNVQPHITTWFVTFLQIFSYGCAVYFFLQTAGLTKKISWMGALFSYPAGLWGWSFTYYGSDFRTILTPYTEILCMALLLFSFISFLKNDTKIGFICIFIAGLVHPPVALYAIFILVIWKLLQNDSSKIEKILPFFFIMVAISILISAPSFLIKNFIPTHPLPLEEYFNGLKLNSHLFPWNFGLHWPPLQITCIWLTIAFLGYKEVKNQSPLYARLWEASLIGSSLLGLSQILSAIMRFSTIIELCGLRSFTITVFISFPLVLTFFRKEYFSHGFLFRYVSLLFLFLPFVVKQYGLSLLLLFSLLLILFSDSLTHKNMTVKKRQLHHFSIFLAWIFVCSFCISVIFNNYLNQVEIPESFMKVINYFFGFDYQIIDAKILLLGTMFTLFVALINENVINQIKLRFVHHNMEYLGIIVYTLLFLIYIIFTMINDRNPEAISRKDVQEWAKENSPVGSVFWAPGFNGWRGYSERRRVDDYSRENYAYIYANEEAKEYRKKLLKFYGLIEGDDTIPLDTSLHEKETKLAEKFDTAKYYQLGREFNVTHVVLKRGDFTAPDLPLIFRNDYYDVYEITGG